VVGATGIYTLQGLLTSGGVIHHSWDVIGQICDMRLVARFLHYWPGCAQRFR
jgi:hypothetical protein